MSAFEKNLIVNGSLNPSLTLDELFEHFTDRDRAVAAWSIAVDLNVYHKHENIPTYNEVNDNPDYQLKALWKLRENTLAQNKMVLHDQHKEEGEATFAALSAIRTPHCHTLRFFPFQAVGYISCLSAWNSFNPNAVALAVIKIEELNIRQDCGINNPNTGKEVTSWEVEGDRYFTLRIKTGGSTKERVKREYDHLIKTIMEGAEPAYIDVTEGEYEMRYTMTFD